MRADLRHRWPGALLLGLLIGLAGAVVVTGVAGARRGPAAETAPISRVIDLQSTALLVAVAVLAVVALARRSQFFLVRLDPDVDRTQALARLQHDFPTTLQEPIRTDDIEGVYRLRQLPLLLAALVALLAFVTLIHFVVATVRRRRGALATLQALGGRRGLGRGALAWHATLVVLAGLVIGVPVGIAIGRLGWAVAADALGGPGGSPHTGDGPRRDRARCGPHRRRPGRGLLPTPRPVPGPRPTRGLTRDQAPATRWRMRLRALPASEPVDLLGGQGLHALRSRRWCRRAW